MITLIIPCWNQVEYTKQCIKSISAKSYPHLVEFVLIDNGSTDGTRAYLQSLNLKHLIINDKNLGISAAWNQGIKRAVEIGSSEIALLNNDIIVGPKWLDPIMREFAKPELQYLLPNGNYHNPSSLDYDVTYNLPALSGKKVQGRCGWAMFFRADAIKHFYPIPEQLFLWHGDDYIHENLKKQGYVCNALLDCCILHYGSRSFYSFPNFSGQVAKDRKNWEGIISKPHDDYVDELRKTNPDLFKT